MSIKTDAWDTNASKLGTEKLGIQFFISLEQAPVEALWDRHQGLNFKDFNYKKATVWEKVGRELQSLRSDPKWRGKGEKVE
jgi:hypothetical protein